MGGDVGIGIFLSFLGNTVNGVGYVTQNIGHLQTAKKKCLYKELRTVPGNERTRLQTLLDENVFDDLGDLGAGAKLIAEARLEEINHDEGAGLGEDDLNAQLERGVSSLNLVWLTGFITYAVGSLMIIASLGFAPAAML